MPHRNRLSLVNTLCLVFLLVLLASAAVAPIGISELTPVSSQPECLRRHAFIHPDQPTTYLSAAIVSDAVLQVNAIASENEEQDRADSLDETRVSFLIPRSFRKDPDRQLIVPRSILSHYPLRC